MVTGRFAVGLMPAASGLFLCGCANLPPYVLLGARNTNVPVGPTVIDLVRNVQCQLRQAVNLPDVLMGLSPEDPKAQQRPPMTIPNVLNQIEYNAVASFILDVQDSGGITAGATFTKPYHGAVGLLPATSAALSVSGTFTDTGHRSLTFDTSVDLDKLLDPGAVTSAGAPLATSRPPLIPCDPGLDLGGDLGLAETFASGLMAAAQNHLLTPTPSDDREPSATMGASTSGPKSSALKNQAGQGANGSNSNTDTSGNSTSGKVSATVDFTVVEGASGGPTWILKYFKGPSGTNGLFSGTRTVKDSVTVVFTPACMKPDFQTVDTPNLWVGETPGWAAYLPTCTYGNETTPAAAKKQSHPQVQQLMSPPPPIGVSYQVWTQYKNGQPLSQPPSSHEQRAAADVGRGTAINQQILNSLQQLVPTQ